MESTSSPSPPSSSPNEKPDRRLRSRSRPNYSDRRTDSRFWSEFPVQIIVGSGKDERTYRGIARDISNGGLLIDAPDVPPTETRPEEEATALIWAPPTSIERLSSGSRYPSALNQTFT